MEIKVEVEEAALAATKEQVEREMDEWYQKGVLDYEHFGLDLADLSRYSYINNFPQRLPDPSIPEGRADLYKFRNNPPDLDETPEEYRKRTGRESSEPTEDSPLRLKTTYRDFYQAIDKALEKDGISLEQLQQMRQRLEESNQKNKYTDKKVDRYGHFFGETLLPVYIRLRAMGFNHYDLTA